MYITEKIDEYLGEKKVFVSARWDGNVLKWRTEDGRTGSDPMKKGTDKKVLMKHFKKVLGSDVDLEVLNEMLDAKQFEKEVRSASGNKNRLENLRDTIEDMSGLMLKSKDANNLMKMIDGLL